MSLEIYLAYIAACAVITLIPGPTVTVIVANSLAHGTRAGLLNVAGTQLGLGLMMAILVVGLSSVIAAMAWLFDWLRIAGAIYLAWIGWKLLRSPDALADTRGATVPRGGFLLQGFLVLMANPKALLWFGAFIPQFVDPKGNYVAQIVLLGLTAMAVALVSDGAYAVLTGRAGAFLNRKKVRLVSRVGGSMLIGGGLWLAVLASAPVRAESVTPGCVNDRYGNVQCPPPGGSCLTDRAGDVRCSPPDGGILLDRYKIPVCGPGQCVTDVKGEVLCSRVAKGSAALDRYGEAVCTEGCVRAAAQACMTPTK